MQKTIRIIFVVFALPVATFAKAEEAKSYKLDGRALEMSLYCKRLGVLLGDSQVESAYDDFITRLMVKMSDSNAKTAQLRAQNRLYEATRSLKELNGWFLACKMSLHKLPYKLPSEKLP